MRLLKTSELAEMLNVSEMWVIRDRKHGPAIPFIKIGGQVRYKMEDIERYLDDQKVEAT